MIINRNIREGGKLLEGVIEIDGIRGYLAGARTKGKSFDDTDFEFLKEECGDLIKLDDLVQDIPANGTYVEIGSYLGCSVHFMASRRKDIKIYSHDLWCDKERWDDDLKKAVAPPKINDIYNKFLNNIKRHGDRIIPIRGDISETYAIHEDSSIDLCFVDGDHSFEGCYRDISLMYPKIKRGGVLAGHDRQCDDVREAVSTFCGENDISPLYTDWSLIWYLHKI